MYNEPENIARFLLEAGAVVLRPSQPFTWASGKKSPIYCDNRLTLSYPETRTYIKKALAEAIKQHFPEAECIAGVATAGIPQGALVADILELPFVYVRASPKGHGRENLIEGKITQSQKVVLIEDLISTGGSSLKAATALSEAGANVLGMVAVFTYGFAEASRNFGKAGVKLVTLSNYNALIQLALAEGYVQENEMAMLKEWKEQADV